MEFQHFPGGGSMFYMHVCVCIHIIYMYICKDTHTSKHKDLIGASKK